MGQFDVHRNTGKNSSIIPYVVIVQSSYFEKLRRRVVVPLEIVSVPTESLGLKVTSLVEEGDLIISALDELFPRAWN